jgi:hypothetical protein
LEPWLQTAKLTASDRAEDDQFGKSVAISGNTVVVGAWNKDFGDNLYQGKAYVFKRPSGGWATMTEVAKLTASDADEGDYFGYNVAVSSDTVVVGAYGKEIGTFANAGKVYVFEKPWSGWEDMTQTAMLTASDPGENTFFGEEVAIDGDTVVSGAHGAFWEGKYGVGAAYVFIRQGAHWNDMTQTAKLTASDWAKDDHFGFRVALDGDTIVVGSHQDDSNKGSAYVFVRPVGGWTNMTQNAKLTASDGVANDFFGQSLSVSGNTVVVAAKYADIEGNADQGKAYVFVRPGSEWTSMTQTARLTADDGATLDYFGNVAIRGDTVLVGVEWDDVGDQENQGSVYLFEKPGSRWSDMTQTLKLYEDGGENYDHFGSSVAMEGVTILIGARFDDDLGQGSAYIFDSSVKIYLPLILK